MREPIQQTDVLPLFQQMRGELLNILTNLPQESWDLPTACTGWNVRDLAQHIFGDDCAYLSRNRDVDGLNFTAPNWEELVALINQHNHTWVSATQRISRKLLIALLEFTGQQIVTYLSSERIHINQYRVDWTAGDATSQWLQDAREMTEYWMHHQHISEALNFSSLKVPEFMFAVLNVLMHALTRAYAGIPAAENTLIEVVTAGQNNFCWHLIREGAEWNLYAGSDLTPTTHITIPQDDAWRLFTKGISGESARQRSWVEGNNELAQPFFQTIAIIA